MADNNDQLETQAELTQTLNQLLADQLTIVNALNSALGSQAGAFGAATAAAAKNADATKSQTENSQDMASAVEKNQGGVDGLKEALGRLDAQTRGAGKEIKSFGDLQKAAAKKSKRLGLAMSGLGAAMEATRATASLAFSAVGVGVNLIKGAFGIVTKFFSSLFGMAADYHNKGAGEMAAANKAIGESFGQLSEHQGKFMKDFPKMAKSANKTLKSAGTSMYNAIGSTAEQMQYATEMASEMGNAFIRLQDDIGAAAKEMIIMNKGAGLSAEAIKQMGIDAQSSGKTLKESLQGTAVTMAHLSNKFGVDVKVIGKNFSEMKTDIENFGHLAEKELVATAAYATKLGIEVKGLQGIMGAFDNFEDAAANAAKLSEAFGMNIDAMKMMNEENPAKRMDMLRESLQATGKSFEDLTRHEKKMMAQTAGMDLGDFQKAMSVDPDDMGFDDFGDAAEEAAEKMTPEEALQEVAKSITKLSKGMTDLAKGPLAAFMQGFMQVIERSPEFKDLMKTIGLWLKEFKKLGMAVANDLLGLFRSGEGKQFFQMFKDIFSLKRLREFSGKVRAAFKDFFKEFNADPKEAIVKLFEKIKKAVMDWVQGSAGSGKGMAQGLAGFVEKGIMALGALIPHLIQQAAEKIRAFTAGIGDFVANDGEGQHKMGDGIGSAFSEALGSTFQALIKDLGPAMVDMFAEMAWQYKGEIISILVKIWSVTLTIALIKAGLKALAVGAVKQLGKLIGVGIGQASGNCGTGKDALPGVADAADDAASATTFWVGLKAQSKAAEQITKTEIFQYILKLGIIGLGMGAAMILFAATLAGVAYALKDTAWGDLAKGFVSMGGALLGIKLLSKIASKINLAAIIKGGLGMIAASAFLGIAGGVFVCALDIILMLAEDISLKRTVEVFKAVGLAMGAVALMGWAGFGLMKMAPIFGKGALGMIVASAFLGVAGGIFICAMDVAMMLAEDISLKRTEEVFKAIAVALGATATLALAGAGIMLLAPYFGLAALGIAVAAGFVGYSLVVFGQALDGAVKKFKSDVPRTLQFLDAIMITLSATKQFADLGASFAVMNFWGGLKKLKRGISAAAHLAETGFKDFTKVIKEIEKMPMTDPKKAEKKVGILGSIMKAVQAMADMGFKAGKMAGVGNLFQTGDPEKMMNAMGKFVTDTVDAMKDIITVFVEMGKIIDPKQQKGIQAITAVINGTASLAQAISGPLSQIAGNSSWYSNILGDGASKQMGSLAEGMADIMLQMRAHIPGLVLGVIFATSVIKDPKKFKLKAEALESVFQGILAMTEAAVKMQERADKMPGKGLSKVEKMEKMFSEVSAVFKGKELTGMVAASIAFIEGSISKDIQKEVPAMVKNIEGIVSMITKLAQFGSFLKAGGSQGLRDLQTEWCSIQTGKGGKALPSLIIKDLVAEANAITAGMKEMKAIKNVELKEIITGVIGIENDVQHYFSIKPEAVNLHLTLNVKMEAEDIAVGIHKGNKATEGFFKTTIEADNMLLEKRK